MHDNVEMHHPVGGFNFLVDHHLKYAGSQQFGVYQAKEIQ
jgi:hypothetical protein